MNIFLRELYIIYFRRMSWPINRISSRKWLWSGQRMKHMLLCIMDLKNE
jgi:hypothetical protein